MKNETFMSFRSCFFYTLLASVCAQPQEQDMNRNDNKSYFKSFTETAVDSSAKVFNFFYNIKDKLLKSNNNESKSNNNESSFQSDDLQKTNFFQNYSILHNQDLSSFENKDYFLFFKDTLNNNSKFLLDNKYEEISYLPQTKREFNFLFFPIGTFICIKIGSKIFKICANTFCQKKKRDGSVWKKIVKQPILSESSRENSKEPTPSGSKREINPVEVVDQNVEKSSPASLHEKK